MRRGDPGEGHRGDLARDPPLAGGEWIAAYRLVPEDGREVVAELRVFPNELVKEAGVPVIRFHPSGTAPPPTPLLAASR